MIIDSSSLTIPVPNISTSSPSGGRFDFDDGGTYCGGWQDGKAHGHGVCTGPKNVGEYSGSWNFGFEMSGVYKWKNGAVYEGRWQNGKRHGVGVEYNGKWIYKGEWSQGFKGRYGVKANSNSAVKYEGTWANGLQDGYGSETYSDGGYYQGQMCRGLRHGYGVRKSAPYGDSQLNNPNKNGQLSSSGVSSSMLIHSNSLQSGASVDLEDDSPKPEDGFKPNIDRTLASKNGFVLVAKPLDVPMPSSSKYNLINAASDNSKGGRRRNSLSNKLASARIPGSNQTASLLRNLGLRKQKSTSDLDAIGGGGRSTPGVKSSHQNADDVPVVPFTLSPEELDISEPTTVETYTGEWKQDKRNGHGICERSDGLKYEGQWHNDMKCGYGVTTFKDKTREEGKYKNNILIVDSKLKRFFQLGQANLRQRIDDAVKMAQQAQTTALKKAEIADTRAATARDKADQATTAGLEAERDSQIAFAVARQYSDPQQQVGMGVLQQLNSNLTNQAAMLLVSGQQQAPDQKFMQANIINHSLNPSQVNSFQMRAMNQQQLTNRFDYGQQQQILQNAQQQVDAMDTNVVKQRQKQFQTLGGVEPFNGRRGSFRGNDGSGSGGASSGYQSNLAARSSNQANPFGMQSGGSFAQSSRQSSTDPFNDLFDHYKPTTGAGASSSFGSHHHSIIRRMPGKQTSLDQPSSRSSNGHCGHFGTNQAGGGEIGGRRFRNSFRMSSMDHAEEHNQYQQHQSQQDISSVHGSVQENQDQADNQHGQFKYLITSGEEFQQQQQQNDQRQQNSISGEMTGQSSTGFTPNSSSYILPQSAGSSFVATQTPSPDGISTSFQSPSGQFYSSAQQVRAQQQVMAAAAGGYRMDALQGMGAQYPLNMMMKQRDVQSLADERLYMAGQRTRAELLDRGDYKKYDFTISNTPRLSDRCMRRTASLSRHAPLRSSELSNLCKISSLNKVSARQRSSSPLDSSGSALKLQDLQSKLNQSTMPDHQRLTQQNEESLSCLEEHQANHMGQNPGKLSHLTPDRSTSSSSSLMRKPSLQVRYDPNELGGLMSREEAAALSHAQREQQRIEAQLAEERASRPILHLYLSARDFLIGQKLVLSILMINILLIKMFADLIV